MIVELKRGYTIESDYDKFTDSYITRLLDNEGNQVRDSLYSSDMIDRNYDIQDIKDFFNEYIDLKNKVGNIENEESTDTEIKDDIEEVEESLDIKKAIKKTKKATKKAKLPALSTLSPIMPDGAAGIETFNSGTGLSEEWIPREELIDKIKRLGFRNYKFDKYTDEQLYNIYHERLNAVNKKRQERRDIEQAILDKADADYELAEREREVSKDQGSFFKDGIEFESEEAAKEYFGESMDRYYWDIDEIERIILKAWEDAGIKLRRDRINISRHDNWCFVEIEHLDDWDFKHINKAKIKKDLKKELNLYDVKQSSWRDTGWGNSDYGKTLRYDLYMFPPEKKEINETAQFYLNDMHEAWDIKENNQALNESIKEVKTKSLRESLKDLDRKVFEKESRDLGAEMLYESMLDKLSSDDVKKLGKFLGKAEDADEVVTYMKGLLSEDLSSEDINKYYKLAEDISNYANKEWDIWQNDIYDVDRFGNTIEIKFYVKGDWKHDHLKFDLALKEFLEKAGINNFDVYEEELDEYDEYDSDYYPSIHVLKLEIDSMNESLNESCDGWIAIYQGKKLEIPKSEANGIYDAKQKAIKELKVPKSKVGMLAIKPAYNESLNEDYVEEWWGQVDENPYEFASRYNLDVKSLDRKHDSTLYRFTGSKEDIDRAQGDGYFYDSKVKKEESDVILVQKLVELLESVGFILDESTTNGGLTNTRGQNWHLQVINPEMHYPTPETEGEDITEEAANRLFMDDLKDVLYVLDKFEDEYGDISITFNFGANKNNIVTGGIDMRMRGTV